MAENLHFGQPVGPERLERFLQHAAAKPALQDAGEPRTVRMIYFVSDPQEVRQEVVDRMKTAIREVQRILPIRYGRTDSKKLLSAMTGLLQKWENL